MNIECQICGACCIAYSISTLNKPSGTACIHLGGNGACTNYEKRPQVCRDFKPDELCIMISVLPLSQKVRLIREVYGLEEGNEVIPTLREAP